MRYIENYELREWVKESLKKSIFQKAHALALQTGCEILVKLEDVVDKSGPQYYATRNLQQAYRHGGISEKPGERCVAGDTGLPTIHTAEIAIQSDESAREPVHKRSRGNRDGVYTSANHHVNKANNSGPSMCSTITIQSDESGREPVHMFDNKSRTNEDGVWTSANHHVNNTNNSGPSMCSTNNTIQYSSPSILPSKYKSNTAPRNPQSESAQQMTQTPESESAQQIVHVRITEANVDNVLVVQDNIVSNNSETTSSMSVKMEVHDIFEDDDHTDQKYLNQSDSLNDDDVDDVMAPLPNEEDFYEDHFGIAGEFDGTSSQMPSHSAMTEHQSTSFMSHQHQSDQQHSPGSSSHVSNIQTSTHSNSNASCNPVPASLSRSTTRMYQHQKPTHQGQHPPTLPQEKVDSMLSYPVTLPVFSSRVQHALETGNIHNGKNWSQFCKEASQFYQPLLDIYDVQQGFDKASSSIVYQSIGRTMYEKYSCIAGKGIRPWTQFNKWLSTKIRQARFQAKKKEQEESS